MTTAYTQHNRYDGWADRKFLLRNIFLTAAGSTGSDGPIIRPVEWQRIRSLAQPTSATNTYNTAVIFEGDSNGMAQAFLALETADEIENILGGNASDTMKKKWQGYIAQIRDREHDQNVSDKKTDHQQQSKDLERALDDTISDLKAKQNLLSRDIRDIEFRHKKRNLIGKGWAILTGKKKSENRKIRILQSDITEQDIQKENARMRHARDRGILNDKFDVIFKNLDKDYQAKNTPEWLAQEMNDLAEAFRVFIQQSKNASPKNGNDNSADVINEDSTDENDSNNFEIEMSMSSSKDTNNEKEKHQNLWMQAINRSHLESTLPEGEFAFLERIKTYYQGKQKDDRYIDRDI